MRLNAPIIPTTQAYRRVAPMSYQEMAYAPSVMQQRQEAAQAQLLAEEEGLQFDYLQQDDPFMREKIKGYENRLTDLSTRLANKGVGASPIRQDITKFKSDYIKDKGIRQAQKNYQDATAQWVEWKKANPNARQQYQEKAKKHFFSGYQGLQDEDGNYRGFTPGEVTGEIDIISDAVGYFNEAGYTQDQKNLLAQVAPDIKWVQKHDFNTGATYMGALITTPGIAGSDNALQLEAGLDELSKQYSDPNTRRGLYARIDEKSPEEITRTLTSTARLMRDQKGGQAPSTRLQGSIINPPSGGSRGSGSGNDFNALVHTSVQTLPERQEKIKSLFSNIKYAVKDGKFDISNISKTNRKDMDFVDKFIDDVQGISNFYFNTSFDATASKKEKAQAAWDFIKKENKNYWDLTHTSNGSPKVYTIETPSGSIEYSGDEGFLELTADKEMKRAAMTTPNYNLLAPKPFEAVSKHTKEVRGKGEKSETFLGDDGKFYSKTDLSDKLKESGLTDSQLPMFLDGDGNLYFEFTDKKNRLFDFTDNENIVKKYTLNPKALPDNIKFKWDRIKELENDFFNLALDARTIKDYNDGAIMLDFSPVGYGMTEVTALEVNMDKDPQKRSFDLVTYSIDGNKNVSNVRRTPANNFTGLYKIALKDFYTDITKDNE